MSTCVACLRRSIKNLEADLSCDTSSSLRSRSRNITPLTKPALSHSVKIGHCNFVKRPYASIPRRTHATLASLKQGHHRRQLQYLRKDSNAKNSPVGKARRRDPWALTKVEIRDAVARDRNRARLTQETHEIQDVASEEGDDGGLARPSGSSEPTKEGEVDAAQQEKALKDSERQERKLIRKDQRQIEVYYKDPLQLAEGVLQRLRASDIEGALRLVRASQAYQINNVVSWNHCCDWLMAQGQIKQALTVYNEMKKRGQKPDAHTYTIMLRGLSQHVNKPNAVQEAVKIYNSIFAPNSAVKPNTIHTNAIINVCARGGDMNSLWAVAGKLPERGAGSPDRITYSTILNAIRENTIKEVTRSADVVKASRIHGSKSEAESAEERTILYAKAVEDARKMWEDISYRWRRADLIIDEQLVCAMGRLLLACGVDRDIEQVLDLVEVTMNLRLKERGSKSGQQVPWLAGSSDPSVSDLPLQESNVYATPGSNTLSMILQACSQKRSIQHLSKAYWWRLTDPNGSYKIRPDAGNIITYLRLLRQQRSSAEALEILTTDWPRDIAKILYRRATFVVALSTCLRDKNNPNVFKIAQRMVKLAEEKSEERALGMFDNNVALSEMNYHKRKQALQELKKEMANMTPEEQEEVARNKEGVQSISVDPKILNYFLELAIATTGGWHEGVRGKDDGTVFERHPSKNHTMHALSMIAGPTKDLRRLIKGKVEEMQNNDMPRRRRQDALDPRGGSRVGEDFNDMLELMRTTISAWDRCLEVHERFKKAGGGGLDEAVMAGYLSRKREMTAYMARVEKSMGQSLRQRETFKAGRRGKEEKKDDEEEEEDDGVIPEVEKRIKAVLGDVDTAIMDSRAEAKARKNRSTARYGDPEAILKIHSRKQQQERESMIEKGVSRAFPKTDFGTLDGELGLVTGQDAEQSQRDEQYRLSRAGFASSLRLRRAAGSTRPFASSKSSGSRNLREAANDEDFSGRYQPLELLKSRTKNEYSPEQGGRSQRSSILDRADVASAWGKQTATRSA